MYKINKCQIKNAKMTRVTQRNKTKEVRAKFCLEKNTLRRDEIVDETFIKKMNLIKKRRIDFLMT